ncbi:restriction endonuclease subunit S [Bacillus safensis]|uniref:restriction endonuclease subunit S n=1 Tax=Bacillus safensis TaxID=561879 RepID=UPI00115DFFD6|nr:MULTISPECIES: restriction endonuclease subunit S [Bacillus]MCP8951681.1 restriction endonuclease subunit S [Bacillus safensis]MEC3736928.1 restriction endonuclease subunit S [Bacillus safensis]TQR25134.1 restriction endonuclease subunit S [Bacillus sp. SDF0016]
MNSINEKIPFLRVLPDGWKTHRLKEISKVNLSNVDKKSHDGEKVVKLCNYVDVYYNHTISDKIDFMIATASDEQIRKLTLKKDDVILTKDSESPSDIGIPTWVKEDIPEVVCGYHLALIRPNVNVVTGLYLYYLLYSYGFKEHFWISAKGVTRFGISKGDIQNIQLLIPPIELQNKITRYLKEKDLLIDKLIKKKENLIMLLQQQRQSIITEAVTKGLNPNVKMKDSGVEWIGEIPEHWDTKKIKYLIQEKLLYGANESAELEDEKLPRYIRITDIDELGNLKNETFKSIPLDIANKYVVKKGDILLARSGATVGKSYIHKEEKEASYAGYLIKLRARTLELAEYIYYFTNSSLYKQWINSILIQATIQNVSAEKYANLSIPVPNDENEIKSILLNIKFKEKEILEVINKLKEQIEKLKEYRQSLIYEAVTGKIDVRDMELDEVR